MTRLRRSFTAEFKLEAASLVLDQGYSVPEASRSLDVGETVLRRWVQGGRLTVNVCNSAVSCAVCSKRAGTQRAAVP